MYGYYFLLSSSGVTIIFVFRVLRLEVRLRDWKVCNIARSSSAAVGILMAFRYNLTKFVRVPENPSAAPSQTPTNVINPVGTGSFYNFSNPIVKKCEQVAI